MLFVPHVRKYVMKRDPGSRQGCIYETTPKLISATGFVRTVQKILYPDYYKTMFPGDYKKK
ncbi:MAG: hypothetical protein A4E63_03353 [Syntrophorhabdus sp. PtaU1.Bin050]|nr:MAG: hypothetical protein A4E63_03353 [Syntrophorhabdus sp. PtaU1.Bin050]